MYSISNIVSSSKAFKLRSIVSSISLLFYLLYIVSKSFLFPQHHAPTLAELVVLGHEFVLEVRGFDVGEAVELVFIAFAVRWAAGAALPFQLGQVDGEAESEAVCRSR